MRKIGHGANNDEAEKKKNRKNHRFFHAMSRISRGNPGRASAVSRFPRFPDRDHQPWEDPHGPRTAEAPPPNDQNDEALLKKNSAWRRDCAGGRCSSALSKPQLWLTGPRKL